MKVFVDANILVSVINKEHPFFGYTARIMSLAGDGKTHIYTTPICLAIAFYFAEKKYRSASAKQRLQVLSQHLEIAAANENAVRSAFADPAVQDFEDGLEYYSALEAGCHCIITEDKSDYHFSKIQVLSAMEFYETHMARGKKPPPYSA
jgi:predicted nucleic acid-binding protein